VIHIGWRTRDCASVLDIGEMGDRHLGNYIRYASTKLHHRITRPPLAIGETP
jgi:hypothetical protein